MPKTLNLEVELIDDHADLLTHGGVAMVVAMAFEEAAETVTALKAAQECLRRNLMGFEHLRKGFIDAAPKDSEMHALNIKLLDSVIVSNVACLNRLTAALLVLDRAAFVHYALVKGRKQ